ncbi:MAG TPA: VOC family protein [Anaerolineae bacterium]|nr:VOC family protein [Anaerolineae bacterium]
MATPDMIGMVVSDMSKALDFYRALGLPIPQGAEKEDHVEVIANGYRIAWDTEEVIKSFNPEWRAPNGSRIGLAFKCENAADVDATFQRLVGKGYRAHKEPWDAFWGQRYAQVQDPDGNVVDLFAAL